MTDFRIVHAGIKVLSFIDHPMLSFDYVRELHDGIYHPDSQQCQRPLRSRLQRLVYHEHHQKWIGFEQEPGSILVPPQMVVEEISQEEKKHEVIFRKCVALESMADLLKQENEVHHQQARGTPVDKKEYPPNEMLNPLCDRVALHKSQCFVTVRPTGNRQNGITGDLIVVPGEKYNKWKAAKSDEK